MDLLGLAIAAAGESLRILMIGYRHIVRGGRQGAVDALDLVGDGFFAHCRNPLYLGNLLIVLGIAIIANAPLFYAVGLPLTLYVYTPIVAAEERYLRGRFGTRYNLYRSRTTLDRRFSGHSSDPPRATF